MRADAQALSRHGQQSAQPPKQELTMALQYVRAVTILLEAGDRDEVANDQACCMFCLSTFPLIGGGQIFPILWAASCHHSALFIDNGLAERSEDKAFYCRQGPYKHIIGSQKKLRPSH